MGPILHSLVLALTQAAQMMASQVGAINAAVSTEGRYRILNTVPPPFRPPVNVVQ